jgi:hypothetical protein
MDRRGTPRSATTILFSFVLLALAAGPTALWPIRAQAQGPEAYGVAVTPRNYPNFTIEDVDASFKLAKRISDDAVFIYQWGELDMQVPRLMVEKSRQADLKPIIGLSPTSLTDGCKELDLTAEARARAEPKLSFANPDIREAFKKSAVELARLQIPHLCLATEINFLAITPRRVLPLRRPMTPV